MKKGGSFNLQGAMMGGAMAYGMASLGEYARAAVPGTDALGAGAEGIGSSVGESGINAATGELGSGLAGNASGMLVDPSAVTSGSTAALNSLSAGMEAGAGAGLQVAPPPSIWSQAMSGNFGDALSQAGQNISTGASNAVTGAQEGIANLGTNISNAYDAATTPSTYTDLADKGMANAGKTVEGIKNLIMDPKTAIPLADAAPGIMAPGKAAAAVAFGGMGLADLDAQADYLNQQQAAGTIDNTEYNNQMALIDAARAKANEAMSANPYSFGTNTATNAADAIKQNPYMFAAGGNVMDGAAGADSYNIGDSDDNYAMGGVPGYFGGGMMRGLTDIMKADPNFFTKAQAAPQATSGSGWFGGSIGSAIDKIAQAQANPDYMALATKALQDNPYKYAEGGMAGGRFLSGGGDGLSDDIPAVIGDKQPSKLADGEFVISSDVVSNLGNGSSKAGAKKLYSMMDRVRQQAHGSKKQISKVNAGKVLPA
jgi:hypothetical protein